MGAWRMPLLMAGTLLALSASAPAAADPDPGDVSVKVGVEATVCVDVPLVSVHIGKCAAPAAQPPTVVKPPTGVKPPTVVIVKPRPVATPKATPRVRVVITPRPAKPKPTQWPAHQPIRNPVRVPHVAPQPVRVKPAKPTPKPTPTIKPTPKPPVAYVRAYRAPPPRPRKNPLGTVLLMVVLTTAIASTTAVAFAAVR